MPKGGLVMGSIWEILGIDQPDILKTNRSKDPVDKAKKDLPKKGPVVEPRRRERKTNNQGVPLPPWLDR
jgi:hypothetical protein